MMCHFAKPKSVHFSIKTSFQCKQNKSKHDKNTHCLENGFKSEHGVDLSASSSKSSSLPSSSASQLLRTGGSNSYSVELEHMHLNRGAAFRNKNYKQANSDLRKMQSEMILKPCQCSSSVCASIDTEVDRLLHGNKPHAYLSSCFLQSLIFKCNDTLCPCRSCHVSLLYKSHRLYLWVFSHSQ